MSPVRREGSQGAGESWPDTYDIKREMENSESIFLIEEGRRKMYWLGFVN